MTRLATALVATFGALTLPACTNILPGVMPHDLRYDAAALERDRCDREPVDPRLYSAALVIRAEPFYRVTMGGPNGSESHLAGAKLELRPLPGVTLELLERGLSCRSAQVMLGHAEAAPNEPYALLNSWVKVDVQSGRGAFVVTLVAEDTARAREVLDRAKAFAASSP